ncbi:unnamed protein product [Larinioides sclopetarius]|uniref:Uncharacterized protein n=1 Tax=Larinioides sclopetarius TaxID=280406 RepID=A0AAV2BY24_9ARAC
MWKPLLVSIVIFTIQGQLCLSRQPGCPQPEDIYPCSCSILRNQKGTLKCKNLSRDEDFKNVIESSKEHIFEEVILQNSNLQYLPHHLFEDVETRILILENLKLKKVFDLQPRAGRKPEELVVENVGVQSGSIWEILQPLENLRTLDVVQMRMRTVGKNFSQLVTENLHSFYFNNTDTEIIETGTFDKFTNLRDLAFFKGSIKKLEREMFPTPFNVDYLAFDYQKLTEIQEGLFTNMPNLKLLSLIGNQIATIPEKAFDSNYHFYNFYLNGIIRLKVYLMICLRICRS